MMILKAGERIPAKRMYDLILDHQQKWINNHYFEGIDRDKVYYQLSGGQCYTNERDYNFFIPLCNESIKEFNIAYGKELTNDVAAGKPKIYALHSSAALTVNIFEYWRQKNDFSKIATALRINPEGIWGMHYEGINEKFEYKINLDDYGLPPWGPDVYFEYYDKKIVALECKYTEPFQRPNFGDKKERKDYENQWYSFNKNYLPKCSFLNNSLLEILKNDIYFFKYLDVKQLIRHIFGLEVALKDRKDYQMIYLYYPVLDFCKPAIFEKNKDYENEINLFSKFLDKDIGFSALTWYDLLRNLCNKETAMDNNDMHYLFYNMDRY